MRKHSLSFLIPTRMRRHVRSFHHVVEVVDWHFLADDVFLRKEGFPCPFFLSAMEGNLGDKFAWSLYFQESRADDEFSVVQLQMPRSWMGEYVSPFFRAIDGNLLQSSNSESCFVDACENGSVVNEQCVTRSSAFFREKTMTKNGRLCCDLELKKLQSIQQRRDEPQGLEPLQDAWWKCFVRNEATNLRDPTGAVERTLSI